MPGSVPGLFRDERGGGALIHARPVMSGVQETTRSGSHRSSRASPLNPPRTFAAPGACGGNVYRDLSGLPGPGMGKGGLRVSQRTMGDGVRLKALEGIRLGKPGPDRWMGFQDPWGI